MAASEGQSGLRERIASIRKRIEALPRGKPWRVSTAWGGAEVTMSPEGYVAGNDMVACCDSKILPRERCLAVADFILHAPGDLEQLIEAIECREVELTIASWRASWRVWEKND